MDYVTQARSKVQTIIHTGTWSTHTNMSQTSPPRAEAERGIEMDTNYRRERDREKGQRGI